MTIIETKWHLTLKSHKKHHKKLDETSWMLILRPTSSFSVMVSRALRAFFGFFKRSVYELAGGSVMGRPEYGSAISDQKYRHGGGFFA
jgi:hypothetical protein